MRYRRGEHTEIEVASIDLLPDIVAELVGRGVRLTRVDPHEPTLEDLYFAVRRESTAPGPREVRS